MQKDEMKMHDEDRGAEAIAIVMLAAVAVAVLLIAILIICPLKASGEDMIEVNDTTIISNTAYDITSLIIKTDHGDIVISLKTGHVELPDSMTIDEASLEFWLKLEEAYGIIKNQIRDEIEQKERGEKP